MSKYHSPENITNLVKTDLNNKNICKPEMERDLVCPQE